MAKKREDEQMLVCPVGRFFMDLRKASTGKSKFFQHLDQSRIEFLKALRSLLDEGIERMEKKDRSGQEKKATKIEVE
jgi:hypothetical protein